MSDKPLANFWQPNEYVWEKQNTFLKFWGKNRKHNNFSTNFLFALKSELHFLLIFTIYIFFPFTVSSSLDLFNCFWDEDENLYYLKTDPDLQCFSNDHSFLLLKIAIPGVIFYGILYPIYLLHVHKNKNAKKKICFDKKYIISYLERDNNLKKSNY